MACCQSNTDGDTPLQRDEVKRRISDISPETYFLPFHNRKKLLTTHLATKGSLGFTLCGPWLFVHDSKYWRSQPTNWSTGCHCHPSAALTVWWHDIHKSATDCVLYLQTGKASSLWWRHLVVMRIETDEHTQTHHSHQAWVDVRSVSTCYLRLKLPDTTWGSICEGLAVMCGKALDDMMESY